MSYRRRRELLLNAKDGGGGGGGGGGGCELDQPLNPIEPVLCLYSIATVEMSVEFHNPKGLVLLYETSILFAGGIVSLIRWSSLRQVEFCSSSVPLGIAIIVQRA
jgi:hypothetical protein